MALACAATISNNHNVPLTPEPQPNVGVHHVPKTKTTTKTVTAKPGSKPAIRVVTYDGPGAKPQETPAGAQKASKGSSRSGGATLAWRKNSE